MKTWIGAGVARSAGKMSSRSPGADPYATSSRHGISTRVSPLASAKRVSHAGASKTFLRLSYSRSSAARS